MVAQAAASNCEATKDEAPRERSDAACVFLFPNSRESGELKMDKDRIVTNGGRVLCITSFAETVYEAVEKSRDVLDNIDFDGIYYRRDIGYEFL